MYLMIDPASTTSNVLSVTTETPALSFIHEVYWDNEPALMKAKVIFETSTSPSMSSLATSSHSFTSTLSVLLESELT